MTVLSSERIHAVCRRWPGSAAALIALSVGVAGCGSSNAALPSLNERIVGVCSQSGPPLRAVSANELQTLTAFGKGKLSSSAANRAISDDFAQVGTISDRVATEISQIAASSRATARFAPLVRQFRAIGSAATAAATTARKHQLTAFRHEQALAAQRTRDLKQVSQRTVGSDGCGKSG